LFVPFVASADQVQEQLRLMEQRMAEMEDRLQATSVELQSAKATVDQQQGLLVNAGLIDEGDRGIRSSVGDFFNQVDVSGVAAASYNHRIIQPDTTMNAGFFKHPNANTFQVDQVWLTIDKAPTEESRGGFHAEYIAGTSAGAQGAATDDEPFLYTAYVSYLAPIGSGIQVDMGKLATPLGAEVIQTNMNFFVTQGLVFGLQPVTHTGISFSTEVTDGIGVIFGVVNGLYSDTAVEYDDDKAYYGQVSFSADSFGLNVGAIWGDDNTTSCVGAMMGKTECETSVVDVVLTVDPTDNLSLWANFDWKHTNGSDTDVFDPLSPASGSINGDAFGIAVAGRLAIIEGMGIATRLEYLATEDSLNGTMRDAETMSLTGTLDKTLAEDLVGRLELRWDTILDDNNNGATFADMKNDQLVVLAQMYYAF
jgi:hypothetical protein